MQASDRRPPGDAPPLVSVGVPVRNGAATVGHVLDAWLRQTCPDIEVVVADNASDDDTNRIVRSYAERDRRVRVIRHDEPISMWANYRSTFDASRGPYFIMSSDNDIPAENYAEVLVSVMENDRSIGNAYSELRKFDDVTHPEISELFPVSFDTRGLPIWRRLLSDMGSGHSTYGIWRVDHLRDFEWYDHAVSPDWPLMAYMGVRSDIAKVPGTVLYKPKQRPKTGEQRAREQSFTDIESWSTVRLSWRCARATRAAAAARDRRRFASVDFALVFTGILWRNRAQLVRWAVDQRRTRMMRPRR